MRTLTQGIALGLGLLIAGLTLPQPAAASGGPTVKIREFGRYETRRSGIRHKAARTASGEVHPVARRKLVERSKKIFGQLGRSFGIEIDMDGFGDGPVTLSIRTLHPPLTNPKTGRTTRVSEYDWPVTGRRNVYFGFTFDETWEIAEGAWTIQIRYQGKLLAEQTFKILVPLN
jgi:hypothetical protein